MKFGTIDNFINYINGIDYANMKMEKYAIDSDIIRVYTKDGREYIFKTKSVMEYEVYFDDYTVEI